MRSKFSNSMTLLINAMLLISAGCGQDPGAQDERKTEAEKQQALRDSTFGELSGTLDRAESVDQLQQERKDKLDATIDE